MCHIQSQCQSTLEELIATDEPIANPTNEKCEKHQRVPSAMLADRIDGWYYKPEMGASASIKSVLPSIAPEFSYSDLEIGNGGLASNTFLSMIQNSFEGDRQLTTKHLLAYCERDTEGMVVIYRHLVEFINSH